MTFQEAINSVFSNYANFSGRARRSEYWYFTLFNIIVSTVLSVLMRLTAGSAMFNLFRIIEVVYSLAVIIPGLAVAWRRLHDTGRSGAWYLLILVPIVGAIVLLVWFCKDSQPGVNEYGPCPKDIDQYSSY
jgi:uncharacterized membrane protein YhaH (DUF805 family)